MLPQLKALANTIRSRQSSPLEGTAAEDHNPIRDEMDAALGSLSSEDTTSVMEFSVEFMEAVKRRVESLKDT